MKTNKFSEYTVLFSLLVIFLCNACKEQGPLNEDNEEEESNYVYTEVNYVRIAALGTSSGSGSWLLDRQNGLMKDYTAEELLDMINELKPDRLERFIAGNPNPGEELPVKEDAPSMTVLQFLNAAIMQGSKDCLIIPELNLQWLDNQESLFWESAQAYRDMSLERPIRGIYLDNWVPYCKNIHTTAEQQSAMLQQLRNMGYTEIFADFTADLDANHPGIDGACLDVNPLIWRASDNQLRKLKSYPNISKVLLHFDAPGTLNKFSLNTADKQADIYSSILYPNQKTQGYNFVFPVIDGEWNSRMVYAGTGYRENSLFEITRDLITKGAFQNLPAGPRDILGPPIREDYTRYVRMIVWARPFDTSAPGTFPHWTLFQERVLNANDGSWYNLVKDYYAEDVIDMIADLQPHCLERFITGTGNRGPGMPVPTRPGNPPMTFEEFLQKAMDAGAPGCHIVPKLDLTWLGDVKRRGDDPMNDETIFWRSARTLYNLDIDPAIRTVCLDCWNDFRENFPTEEERAPILEKLRDMGFTEIQLNYTGAANLNHPLIDVAKWNIQTSTWMVNETALNRFKGWPNLKEYLLYIDYPGPMDAFLTQFTDSPHPGGYADRQADMLISNIIDRQDELGFTYVFPFFQNGYDPTTFRTSPTGKYKGKTMYDIQKELLFYGEVQ